MEALRGKSLKAFKAIDIDASNSLSHQELHSVHGGDVDGFFKDLNGATDTEDSNTTVNSPYCHLSSPFLIRLLRTAASALFCFFFL